MTEDEPPQITILDMLRRIVAPPGPTPVDLDLTEPPVSALSEWAEQAAALWHSSMFEFLSGVEVTDFSDSISGDDFQQLFGS
jgi:hypothetical protein